MRRAFSRPPPGPARAGHGRIPADVVKADARHGPIVYEPVRRGAVGRRPARRRGGRASAVAAKAPLVHAGQGVLYAQATAELLDAGRAAQAAGHDDAAGQERLPREPPARPRQRRHVCRAMAATSSTRRCPARRRLQLHAARHDDARRLPAGKTIIHATNDPRDLHKTYDVDLPILGDARLVLRATPRGRVGTRPGRAARSRHGGPEIAAPARGWLAAWRRR